MDLNQNFVDNENDIVISGIAGRFPESDSMDELRDNLYANIDLISEDDRRWPLGLYGLPTRSGKLKTLNKFDAQFFGVNGTQADYMDPQGRILLEVTYEAIVDSGWNPTSLRGTNTGVYIGAFLTESEESLASDPNKTLGYGATGTKRNMLANRVSFAFDLKGPSFAMDSACSSSLVAFQLAYSAIRANECDMAVVGGVNVNLRPASALEFHRLNMLATDGKCKFLDASAKGYVRSETVSALLLQKRKYAKRVYATVIHAKTNSDGYTDQGITYPSSKAQADLMEATLKESGVNPDLIDYVEAHGTGTPAGDANESNAIFKVYCKNRSDPLRVGSVKSNLGHTESASGMCSVAKMVIAFENRKIPASLHLKHPNPNIRPLIEGSILPVTENHDFEDSVVAVNSFGFGGTNVHILIRPNQWTGSEHREEEYNFDIPRLIVVNGRTEESVNHVLDFIHDNRDKVSEDFLSLLADVTTGEESDGMDYHGFVVRDVSANEYLERERRIAKVLNKRQVWFILSGMGTQWTGMAKGLMDIKVFNQSIRHSAQVLEPFGIDLMQLILGDKDEDLAPILASSVGIAAVQIALVDLVRELGIKPDGYIGHSSGELCCGYLDEGLDAREMLLYAYWRGKCVEQAKMAKGLMAAVGLPWAEAKKRCPPGVVAACHNAPDSVTISGAYEEVDKFLTQLKSENIFTKKVNSCDIPFHSTYMKAIAPELLKKMKSVTSSQKIRSRKWISSSVPEVNWSTPEGKMSNAEYYMNNLISPVLFQEALQFVPKDAIVIEISPDSLFRNVTKRSLGTDCSYVGLMSRKNRSNNVSHLLTSIGELFNLGLKPKIDILYPKIAYPVKRGTQSLGSLIRWDHSDNWLVTLYPNYFNPKSQSELTIEIDFKKEENHFYFDHCIDSRKLFPATGYLYLVWDELARQLTTPRDQLPVIFENVRFLRATIIAEESVLSFKLILSKINGEFNLYEADFLTVTGRIRTPTSGEPFLPLQQKVKQQTSGLNTNSYRMDSKDVYKELRIRGYHYGRHFRPILSADIDTNRAKFTFNDNWITYSDAMLHFSLLKIPTRELLLPTSIQSLHCDPRLLAIPADQEYSELLANLSGNYSLTNGLEIYGLGCSKAVRKKATQELVLEKYIWVPYMQTSALDSGMQVVVETYLQVIEDLMKNKPKKRNNDRLNQLNSLLAINGFNSDLLVLKNIIENLNTNTMKEPIKQLAASSGQKMSSDLLNNLYFEESLLRPALDIVLENNSFKSNQEFKVLEINLNQENCYQKVINYIKDSFYNLRVKYSVYNPSESTANSDNSYEKIDINFSMSTKIANTEPLSLVIIRDPFPSKDAEIVSYEDIFRYVNSSLETNGFMVILKRNEWTKPEKTVFTRFGYNFERISDTKTLISMADKMGLSLVSHRSDSNTSSVLLFRKTATNETTDDLVIRVTHSELDSWFEKLKNALKSDPNDQSLIWLVSDGENSSGIVGFVNCLRKEPGGHRIRCISDLMFENLMAAKSLSVRELIDSSIFDNNLVMNIYKNSELGSYRHLSLNPERMTKSRVKHAMIMQSKPNDNSMFEWFESKHNSWKETDLYSDHNLLINVFYAGLNESDLHRESADTSDYFRFYSELREGEKGLSSEFSGVDESGKRYFGIKPNECLSTTLVFDNSSALIQVPEKWSLAQACSVPIAYGTGYLALVVRAQLQKNQTILIHAGDGYVGRAAIAIAQSLDCDIYTTVRSVESKKAVLAEFPDLNENKIINTSIDCFKQTIIEGTDGKGVEIVYNYTNEYNLDSSLFSVKQNGRFITIVNNNRQLIGNALSSDKNIIIDKINFADIFNESTEQSSEESITTSTKYQVLSLIEDGISDNVVKPLNTRVFSAEDVSQALDYMSKNANKDKVLVKIRAEEQNGGHSDEGIDEELVVSAVHNTRFSGNKTYIITGGLGGFGLELANWLVSKGAKNLVLTSRNGIKNYFQDFNVERLRRLGAQVVISRLDATNEEQCEELVREAELLAPVGGIFSLAMVLSDGIFENQTQESMQKVLAPKVLALKHLDLISREMCPELQYFVAFSSVTSGRGNGGQSNYGYANSYMERLCELRREDGFPALAIQWGAVADVGVVSDLFGSEGADERAVGGTVPQRIHSCLSVLNHFLHSTDGVVSSLLRNEIQVLEKGQKRDIVSLISGVLGIRDSSKIRHRSKLPELGMDSLMIVEIKQSLEREFQLSLNLQQLNDITFAEIIQMNKTFN